MVGLTVSHERRAPKSHHGQHWEQGVPPPSSAASLSCFVQRSHNSLHMDPVGLKIGISGMYDFILSTKKRQRELGGSGDCCSGQQIMII